MKNILLFIITLGFACTASAQTVNYYENLYGKGKMPYNENGNVVFEQVVTVEGHDAQQLFSAIQLCIVDIFHSAKDVTQMCNDEQRLIIVKSFQIVPTEVFYGRRKMMVDADVWFTLKIQARNNRYKITIYDIYGRSRPNIVNGAYVPIIETPAESCTYESSFEPDGSIKKNESFWRRAIIDGCNTLLESIPTKIKTLLSNDSYDKEDW